MAKPTITYCHGYLSDCNDTTGWGENRHNMIDADAELTVENNDIFKIKAVFDEGATDEYCYYEKDISNISSDTYSKFLLRWKTSASADGAKAKVLLVFTSGTQTILEQSYSTTWQVTSGTITPGKTIDKIHIFAEDDGTNGTFYVYYDFILLHAGTFTFPNTSRRQELLLDNLDVNIGVPARLGSIPQYLGAESPRVELSGDMKGDTTSWGSPLGQYLMQIWFERHSDPWQWFTSDLINCKMRLEHLSIRLDATSNRVWNATLRKYDGHTGNIEWVWDYFQG